MFEQLSRFKSDHMTLHVTGHYGYMNVNILTTTVQ